MFALVVVSLGQPEVTENCFKSLAENTKEDFALYWVQNEAGGFRKENKVIEEAFEDKLDFHILRNENNDGFTRGTNKGVTQALQDGGYSFVSLLNNDTQVPLNWHKRLTSAMPEDCGAISPFADSIDDPQCAQRNHSYAPAKWHGSWREFDHKIETATSKGHPNFLAKDVISYCCVVVPSKVWDEVGLLDERFGKAYGEDNDHSHRIRLAGYKIGIGLGVCIHHERSVTTRSLKGERAGRRYKIGQNQQAIFNHKWAKGHPPEGYPPSRRHIAWWPYSDFQYGS